MSNTKGLYLKINQLLHLLYVLVLAIFIQRVNTQNSCTPSSANDKFFIGSSNLALGMIKPGINTYTVAPGIIQSLTNNLTSYNSSQLQISHNFRNFIASPVAQYEMNDFSSHSLIKNNTINFIFLWNEISTISTNISLTIQFMIVYQREEFLLGSFAIGTFSSILDTIQFLIGSVPIVSGDISEITFSRILKFKDYSTAITSPNQNSSVSVILFITGIRQYNTNAKILLKNQIYNISTYQLSFTVQQQFLSTISTNLQLLHINYVLFDKTYLSSQYKIYSSSLQLQNDTNADFWMRGLKQINFKETSSANLVHSEFYFYKLNRLQCIQGCSGCVSSNQCTNNFKGQIINDSQCIVCNNGFIYNPQTLKCESNSCGVNQTWNNTQCICKSGYVRIGSQCGICPSQTLYNSTSLKCDPQCGVNESLVNNQCVCKTGFYIVEGKCSKCLTGTLYEQRTKKCILNCNTSLQIYNSTSKTCECVQNLYRINSLCSACPSGFIYNATSQSCSNQSQCPINQVLINGKCNCSDGFVIISGKCGKCPTATIYNSLQQNCTPICSGNRTIFNGKCVCKQGFLDIGNQCSTCPLGTQYNISTKSCNTLNCSINQTFINGKCSCNGPYLNGSCQPCSSDFTFNLTLNMCIPICPSNSYFNSTYNSCVCNLGFYVIGNQCSKCPNGSVYDFSTLKCQSGQSCTGQHQVYFQGYCVCDAGYFRINTTCGTCPQGTIYNQTLINCQTICGQNQVYNSVLSKCQCNSALEYYKINGSCQKCPSGTSYNTSTLSCQNNCPSGQVVINGNCSCPTGFYLINGACGICQIGTIYNSTAKKCDKLCSDPNGYYQNGKCFCYPPYIISNQTSCVVCPSGTTYDLPSQSCKQNAAPTPTPNNQSITCNSTSEIKTLNTTSGNYYCACNEAMKYYFIYDRCGTCQYFTKYNAQTLSCQLDLGSLVNNPPVQTTPSNNSMIVGTSNSTSNSTAANSTSSECLSKDNKVLINGICKCISSAILINNTCIPCQQNSTPNVVQSQCLCNTGYQSSTNNTCKKSTLLKQNSTQCALNQMLKGTQCICISQFYKINGTCLKCPLNSQYNGTTCICQLGFYSQTIDSNNLPTTCLKCHQSCSFCTGSAANQCLKCKNISDVLNNGSCIQQSCQIGFYYQQYSSTSKCQKCSSYCKQCTSSTSCTTCIDRFQIYQHIIANQFTLRVCSQICGDGKRFERNCDDGNKLSGDGCNSTCQIQPGYICVGGTSNTKDKCYKKQSTTKAIIQIRQITIQAGSINQNIKLSYIPDYFLQQDCSLCYNLFKITLLSANIIPDLTSITYIQKSKYQFNIKFIFNDVFSIPPFKFGVQINPQYKDYFSQWDMAQFYQVQVDSALLAKKNNQTYLRSEQIIN